jgi:MFS transporter, SP family, sugar:H+ symporter
VLYYLVKFASFTTQGWFITRGEVGKANTAIRTLRGDTYSEEELQDELQEIEVFVQMEKEIEGNSSFLDCFKGTDHTRTRIVIMILVCQQFTGISFITA